MKMQLMMKPERHEFSVPVEVQRLEQYFGVWACENNGLRAAVRSMGQENLASHAANYRPTGEIGAYRTDGDLAIVDLVGTMTKYGSSMSMLTYGTVGVRKSIRRAVADKSIKRIGLVIHSNGGTVEGTGDLAEEVRVAATKKPVIAYIEDMCASAAYWVASQATRIVASPSAMIGSIGVYMIVYDESEAAEQQGVKAHVIRTAEFKGAGAPGTEITDAQLAEWQRQCDEVHELFGKAVMSGRSLSVDEFERVATGSVWHADKAKKLKLIDDIKSYAQVFGKRAKSTLSVSPTGGRRVATTTRRTLTMSETNDAMSVAEYIQTLRDACPGASDSWLLAQATANVDVDAAKAAHYKRLAEEAKATASELETAKTEIEKLTKNVSALTEERDTLSAKVAELTEELEKAKSGPGAISGETAKPTDTSALGRARALCAERMASTGETREKAWMAVMEANPELREELIREANDR